jgi:hypothetical protein
LQVELDQPVAHILQIVKHRRFHMLERAGLPAQRGHLAMTGDAWLKPGIRELMR